MRPFFREPARLRFVFVVLLVLLHGPAQAAREAIASSHRLATEAGMQILAKGGNAFDAAIAVAAALAVVEPYSSGLGGGGFFLLHRNADGFQVMVDAREKAPGKAKPDLYIDAEGKPDSKASVQGMEAAAIPGLPAALPWLAQRYGRLPLETTLAPAIRFARDGFATDERYTFVVGLRRDMLVSNPQLAGAFLDQGQAPKPGFIVRQPDLARTLQAISAQGKAGFYGGDVARRMVNAVQAGGGIWELQDLQQYQIVDARPSGSPIGGRALSTAALPSAGGLTLAQSLQILERYPLAELSAVDRMHVIAEALRRGYQDRVRYLGDPDYVTPPERLRTRAYADQRAATMIRNKRLAAISSPPCTRATTPRISRSWIATAIALPLRCRSICRSVRV